MDMNVLCSCLVGKTKLEREIFDLIMLKKDANEKNIVSRNKVIDSFIESMQDDIFEVQRRPVDGMYQKEADTIFRSMLHDR